MATDPVPSEIIERERKKVLEILQQDPESVLDTLTSRRLISEEEYESLETITDPLKKSRKLLILVQKKGEVGCLHFLKCLVNTFPDSATVWDLNIRQDLLKHETIEQSQSTGRSKISEDDFSSCNKQSENAEIMPSFEEKGQLDLRTSEFLGDKNISDRETASSSKGKGHDTPTHTFSYAVEDGECEVPFTIAYLRDGQRYEEPDDSLYLGKEEYLELIGYVEDAETTLEKDHDDPEHVVQGGEEDPVYAEVTEFSDDAQSYEESETGVLLEEEEEEDEESMEEKKQVFKDILSCLNMNRSRKLLPDSVKQFSLDRGSVWVPETPGDLVWDFLVKVQAQDVTARDSVLKPRVPSKEEELLTEMEHLQLGDIHTINHLDVLCAAMLCSDSSLQSEIMSNMHHCQFALPLLLPDAENNRSILMLGAMKRIVEKQSAQSSESPAKATENLLTHIKTPVISFVRLQSCSVSKSRILNTLLSPTHTKLHEIFLHRDSSAFQLPRQISDGLVEITWCFPDGEGLKENRSCFQKPVAVTNLRGDLECFWIQFGFLMEVSSAVFVFTDFLGEKEWNLLRFLEEAALEKCYFVLSSQAKESEEAHVFQRILKLKSSQLLFLEGEGAGDTGKGLECLQAVLQEVVCSSFRFMSVEDMASLARELGIQVDQDCENSPGIQGSTGENMAGEVEGQQRHNQPKPPEQMPTREPGYLCGVSQNPQNVCSPVSVPPPRISSPFPPRIRGNFNQASLKPPWVMGSHFWSEQRYRWFRPLTFHNRRAHHRGKHFGPSYFQPQRFYSDERIMNFSRISQGSPWNVRYGMQPRPAPQHAQAWAERPKPVGMFGKSGTGTSQGGHLHSTGSQPAGTFGKSQHRVVCAQGTQLATATGKLGSTASHIKDPPHQASHPEGGIRKFTAPASQHGAQGKTQGGSSNPAFQAQHCPMSHSRLFSSSQSKCNQLKNSQPKPFQPAPSQTKPTQPQPSQSRAHQSTPSQPKPSQSHAHQSIPTQPKPSQSHAHQSTPTQPKPSQSHAHQSIPTQPKPSQSHAHQSTPTQSKPSQSHTHQFKPTQSKPSQSHTHQFKPTQSKPSQSHAHQSTPTQSKPSQSHTHQFKPTQPKCSQSKSSQPRPSQTKSSRASFSQTKVSYSRAGSRR